MKCTKCNKNKPLDDFYMRKDRGTPSRECKMCFRNRMGDRHQKHKDVLVNEFGGKCSRCGYDTCARILNFHHINLETKEFGIAEKLSSNLKKLRKEAAKCILLCPNCHCEKHQGLW